MDATGTSSRSCSDWCCFDRAGPKALAAAEEDTEAYRSVGCALLLRCCDCGEKAAKESFAGATAADLGRSACGVLFFFVLPLAVRVLLLPLAAAALSLLTDALRGLAELGADRSVETLRLRCDMASGGASSCRTI